MKLLINLTPHDINVINKNNQQITIHKSGKIARINTLSNFIDGVLNDFNVVQTKHSKVINMPSIEDCINNNFCVIVSSLVLEKLSQEWSCIAFSPDTGDTAIRNDSGHIVAVKNLRTI